MAACKGAKVKWRARARARARARKQTRGTEAQRLSGQGRVTIVELLISWPVGQSDSRQGVDLRASRYGVRE